MDLISHIIFGLTLTRLVYMNRPQEWEKYRNIIILIAIAASLFPDIDILTTHRSEIHAPLVLAVLAGVIGLAYPLSFKPLLVGFLSHSLLDVFLFDNSNDTIRQIIDIAITNDTAASEVNEVVVTGIAANGIMLLYPISRKMYSIMLTETTYAMVAGLVLSTAAITLYLTRNNTGKYR
ncbi:MAG: metal-dependent hydrolase [Methanosarcinales archaeon]|nr:metal-dependent hydrolase [Methanosarcinales archaeon]